MKIRILIYLAVLLILITGCNSASTDVEKISTVTVTENGGEPYDLELSRSVALPISLADAIFIMEECNSDTSIGDPVLNDENWVLYCCPEYPDWDIRVNRNNGNVSISEFG